MQKEICDHLWVTPGFAEPAAVSLKQTLSEIEALSARLAEVKKGFEDLPKEVEGQESQVAPVISKNEP